MKNLPFTFEVETVTLNSTERKISSEWTIEVNEPSYIYAPYFPVLPFDEVIDIRPNIKVVIEGEPPTPKEGWVLC